MTLRLTVVPFLAVALLAGCEQNAQKLSQNDATPAVDLVLGTNVHKLPWQDASARGIRTAATNAHLNYYGGHVLSNVKVYAVFWGPNVASVTTQGIGGFFTAVTNSAYFDWLSEYNTNIVAVGGQQGTNQSIGRGSFAGTVTITPANQATTIDDTAIQTELNSQISAGHLPAPDANTLYMTYFPPGMTITQGGSNSCQAGGFCAYHGTFSRSGSSTFYGVLPDMSPGSGCDTGCGGSTQFNNQTSVSSHEMIESVTDAEVGLATVVGPPLAWYDTTNGEIGDICNAQQGTIAGYTVQLEWSNVSNACIVSRAVANDFSISASPSTQTVTAGAGTSYSVSTTTVSGSPQTVSLTATGQPTGVTVSFSPASVTSGSGATMNVSTGSSTVAGTYTLTIHGTGSSATHTTTVSLTVNGVTTNNFSISLSPTSGSVTAGSGTTSAVSTATTSGSAQTVNLSASGQPSGATVSFSPSSVTSGSGSTMTISTTSSTAAGTYSITVTGTGASATHTASYSLTVTSGTGGGSVVNGGFETGDFTGWTRTGAATSISNTAHTGAHSAQLGATTPTNGDSTISQTFTLPSNGTSVSFWYKMTCPDTVTYDWATATLTDNTTATTTTMLAKICTNNAWTQVSTPVTGGHSVTLTLVSHDDNYPADPSFTLYDDVAVGTGSPPPSGIINGGFESAFTGWTRTGAATSVSTTAHGGSSSAQLGAATPTNGDSSVSQTFTMPAGSTTVSFWYQMTCPDTVTYDWATATLHDNTSGTTTTMLAKICTNNSWTQVSASATAGHSMTLTLTSHDDNYPADPSFTLYDDATTN